MSYAIDPLVFNQFKGIREFNGVNYGNQISAINCQNVELIQTEIGNNTGIKSTNGNKVAYALPVGYRTIEVFESEQEGVSYTLIYGENDAKGTLFYVDPSETVKVLIDDLTLTGECNGLTMSSTAFDVFVFTNGKEVRTVCFTNDTAYEAVIENNNPVEFDMGYVATINAVDYEGKELNWLSMTEWNGFLTVASAYGVNGSHQNDIYKWNDDPQDTADSWYIRFSKKVTAIQSFIGGLYIFTNDECTLLTASPNDSSSVMKTSAGIGCYSYTSLVKHDAYLFFYDNNQKNIYYLQATDTTGQIRPTGPVAKEIQSFFNNIKRFKMVSCVYENRNEIWCLINDKIVIYNYLQQEWLTREEQAINGLRLINNTLYSAGENGVVYAENTGDTFNGAYFPCVYETTLINAGSNTNIKKQKTPLLITVNSNFVNKFYVELTIDNKPKQPKQIFLEKLDTGIYANEDGSSTDPRTKYAEFEGDPNGAKYSPENTYKKVVRSISTPQTWYTMKIKIYTQQEGEGFFITSMELKNMKMKTKTRGR